MSPVGTGAIFVNSPFPAKGRGVDRGCITFKFPPGWFCHLFYYFFGVRGSNSKTIKTGLNCRQYILCIHVFLPIYSILLLLRILNKINKRPLRNNYATMKNNTNYSAKAAVPTTGYDSGQCLVKMLPTLCNQV